MKNKTVNEGQEIIDKYFIKCAEEEKVPTVSGLAFSLNTSRLNLLGKNNGKFNKIIEKALTRCEAYIEELLITGKNATGLMFILKNNFSWNEKLNSDLNEANVEIVIKHPWEQKTEVRVDDPH